MLFRSYSSSQGHGHSQSVSHIDVEDPREFDLGTPSRRSTFNKQDLEGSAIPTPTGIPRRKSGGNTLAMTAPTRRTSSGVAPRDVDKKGETGMKPPAVRSRKLSEVGETY